MTAISEAVATYLATTGLGSLGGNIFAMTMPDSPYVCTVAFATGGPNTPGNPTKKPRITVQHRNTSVASGFSAITSIHAALNNQWNIFPSIPGRIFPSTEIGAYFRDRNGHPIYAVSYDFYTTKQSW